MLRAAPCSSPGSCVTPVGARRTFLSVQLYIVAGGRGGRDTVELHPGRSRAPLALRILGAGATALAVPFAVWMIAPALICCAALLLLSSPALLLILLLRRGASEYMEFTGPRLVRGCAGGGKELKRGGSTS